MLHMYCQRLKTIASSMHFRHSRKWRNFVATLDAIVLWQLHVIQLLNDRGYLLILHCSSVPVRNWHKHKSFTLRIPVSASFYTTFCRMLQSCASASTSLISLGSGVKGKSLNFDTKNDVQNALAVDNIILNLTILMSGKNKPLNIKSKDFRFKSKWRKTHVKRQLEQI